jgi:hypothetical protein
VVPTAQRGASRLKLRNRTPSVSAACRVETSGAGRTRSRGSPPVRSGQARTPARRRTSELFDLLRVPFFGGALPDPAVPTRRSQRRLPPRSTTVMHASGGVEAASATAAVEEPNPVVRAR